MQTYIIHVKTAFARATHIAAQLAHRNLATTYILDADIADLPPSRVLEYFAPDTGMPMSAISCAIKHLLAYRALLESGQPYALILEDDIMLAPDFEGQLAAFVREINTRKLQNILVSLEDSNLQYVKGSARKVGQYLYAQKAGRLAGAYLIDRAAAQTILAHLQTQKATLPIDWQHLRHAEQGNINIYWSHPTIACQASLNGVLASSIDQKQVGALRRMSFFIQRIYKKILYGLR